MYKVELSEKEAQTIGAMRWGKTNKRRYFIRSSIALGAAVVLAALTCSFTGIPSWVFGFLTAAALLCALFFPYRLDDLAAKAGKAFAQSLKEGK